jgi:hypothetical protein
VKNQDSVHEYTRVVYRVFKDSGDVIALFPNEINYPDGSCDSYQRIGQHGAANYAYCMRISRPATFEEWIDLHHELESIGYKLKRQKRKSA